jgi:16S rRNA (adenine1518-N6/adenine1519-N6)-dimethyltransferase
MADLLTPSTIRASLAAHGLRPSRALGQHFLADPNTARRIVRLAAIRAGDPVIEVGPGLGSLTLALIEAGASITAVEVDRYVIKALHENVGAAAVRVVQGDALDVDWDALAVVPGTAMVANLPYNVATPVVVRALETSRHLTRYLVMVQREVGERLAATPGSKTYGAVSVKVAFYARAEVVAVVPPTVFVPQPRVESAIVALTRHGQPPVDVADPTALFALVRAGFATRRKMVRQALRSVLGDATLEVLGDAGIAPTARAEELDLAAWAALAAAARGLR